MDPSVLSKFDVVCSGHFHHKSSQGSIHYLGAFAEHNWGDYDDPRGFHVFDTKTRELTFIPNPNRMFFKLWYDDTGKRVDEVLNIDRAFYSGTSIKVIVTNKTNPLLFDSYIEALESCYPFDIQVVEDHMHLNLEPDEVISEEGSDTLTVFTKYIDGMSDKIDKVRLTEVITNLHNGAITLE